MHDDTQHYLDEAATTDQYGPDALLQGLAAFIPTTTNATEQAATLHRLLQVAELTESDPAIRQLFEEGFMHLRSIQRVSGDLQKSLRELASALQQHRAHCAMLRAAIAGDILDVAHE